MPGKNTLSDLYLGSDPINAKVQDDQVLITLANDQKIAIPLQLIGQLQQSEPFSAETQLIILRQPPQIDHVHVTDSTLNVYLVDGRLLACPLAWFPRLLHASSNERNYYELMGNNDIIHWPTVDEDIELSRLIEGGKSVESERSLQRWLQSRQSQLLVAAD